MVSTVDGDLLAGRHALITGAGGVIGPTLIDALQRQGATVWFTDKSKTTTEALQRQFPQAVGVVAEIAETDAILDHLDAAKCVIDILVNNVGVSAEKHPFAETDADVQRVFETNLFGPMRLTRAIAARMVDAGKSGSVVFVSSVHAESPALWPSYGASRAALSMVVRELAAALAPNAIRVNAVAPGWVSDESKPHQAAILGRRTISPQDIAHGVAFLASDVVSSRTTGTTLTIDAGMSLHGGRVS